MQDAIAIAAIRSRYNALSPLMDERLRRQWAAAEARSYGWGGKRAVSRATGMSAHTIAKGWAELTHREAAPDQTPPSRLRRVGGGRKRATAHDPDLDVALLQLIDPTTRGDP